MSVSGNSLSAATKFTARASTTFDITSDSAIAQRGCWLLMQPIDDEVLKRRDAPIHIKTVSHHQGWVDFPDKGSWSWFELAIVSASAQVDSNGNVAYDSVKKAGDKTLAWLSHSHPVDQKGTFETFEHSFPYNHEIWKHLKVGDRLAVFGCAQYPRWSCTGCDVELKIGQVALGTVTRKSPNRISCDFVIGGYTLTFDATLMPSLSAFTSKTAKICYMDKDDLTGTSSFSGYFGQDDFMITIADDAETEIATISGDLNEELKKRNQVDGTGTWMSS
ncbi:hypothetical protein ACEPAI_1453 [Sanghuangporus weigelae]